MKIIHRTFSVFCFILILFSCKNDPNDNYDKGSSEKEPIKKTINKEIKTIKQIPNSSVQNTSEENNVLINLMYTPELKTFVRVMVTAEMTNLLINNEEVYTVFAPTNKAFDNIADKKMKFLLNPKNKEVLKDVLNTHIIEGNMDFSSLVEAIKNNGGTYKLNTLSGATLTASMNANNIIIKDKNGVKSTIGKSDIIGTNGVIHIIDMVFVLD